MAKIKQTIDAVSMDKLSKILGTFDENLNFLSRELNIRDNIQNVDIYNGLYDL